MILLKLLINLSFAACLLLPFYSIFYFKLIPWIIEFYRKAVSKSKQYEAEFKYLNKEDE